MSAIRNRTKVRKSQSSPAKAHRATAKAASQAPNFPTPEQIAAFRRQIGIDSAEREQRQAAVDAAIERRKREGVQLRGPRLKQAELTLSAVHLSALALGKLAVAADSTMDGHEASHFLTAVEDVATLMALRCDTLANLLGDDGFGDLEELKALTEEQAERMEREEAGREDE